MNKKGFTLVELLVVIVIIGVLSIIVVPSVININKNINSRLYEDKKEKIENAAQLYANNNEELFNGTTQITVYVRELVADWLAAGRTYNGKGFTIDDELKWWHDCKDLKFIHPNTKKRITELMESLNC